MRERDPVSSSWQVAIVLGRDCRRTIDPAHAFRVLHGNVVAKASQNAIDAGVYLDAEASLVASLRQKGRRPLRPAALAVEGDQVIQEGVNYEEFKEVWAAALRESRLPLLHAGAGKESLDLQAMDRTFESFVEPVGGQDAEPFHVSGTFSFRWDSILTARTASTEEDLLTELLGHENPRRARTTRPSLRVDVTLRASLPFGKAILMPEARVWAAWAREVLTRLEAIEAVIPEENVREGRAGRLEVLAWQGEPVAHVQCGRGGELRLKAIELSSWQAIELVRNWDDPSRKPDEHPHRQLSEMFGRVRSALHAWMEVMDHLHHFARS